MAHNNLDARRRAGTRRGDAAPRRRPLWLAVGAMLGVAVLALAGAPAALAAIDVYRAPEEVRSNPVPPTLNIQRTNIQRSDLSAYQQPDYGSSAPVGNPVRDTFNNDATTTGREIDQHVAQLDSDPNDQDLLKKCAKNALWGILFDGVYDAVNGYSFDVNAELSTATNSVSQCVQNQFGVGTDVSAPVAAWIMQSVTGNGSDVATNYGVAAFINWVAVTAWYRI
jgi:hypothetical protein